MQAMNNVILKLDKKFGLVEAEVSEIRQTLSTLTSVQSSHPAIHSCRCPGGQEELVATVQELKAGQVKVMHDVTENLAKTSSNLEEIRHIKQQMTSFMDNMNNEAERVKKSSAEMTRSLSEKCEKISQSQDKLTADVIHRIDKMDDVIKVGSNTFVTDTQSEIQNSPTSDDVMNKQDLMKQLEVLSDKMDKLPNTEQITSLLKQELAENTKNINEKGKI